ncbi:Sporulation domain protein [Psychromonas ingrahamii 37]|uniref:Sporulation domain protein n=1 Tax=Psychromonas ingrahamii (strain DSM 17664 / CCUG 51855 / 37) TaxID=357804 RepID=A1SW70_PSYIN|nr:SPOR domain-containing protein [Psychromonas ingrahamii]ABM03735.1 Sporulation domain protein [Psychromonas ingrahamii 37]
MASQFKNRLVGVTILVASVVIFLPTIIDGEKISYQDEFTATPIQPETKKHTFTGSEPDIIQTESNLTTNRNQLAIDPIEGKNKKQETQLAKNDDWEIEEVTKPVTLSDKPLESVEKTEKKQFPESAWIIQLGAFENAENINTLLKQLQLAGFQVHTVPQEVIDGVLTRVFVGPDVSQKRLKEQLPRLKKVTQLQGKILPFKAINP